ncbi:OmpA family protein [Trichocoleus sp. FACHB-262]|uniref:OmpA family protein n=1 Tax=Trichocoleus sp. FACHB-262 TaxID=2692869 RepID=UPI00168834DD|nr:OmpA family protein [Trichocoleus sp. FACHB-262]MBD2122911.1 OmpA family protein [Trichocoleus sp. FACHB-262]
MPPRQNWPLLVFIFRLLLLLVGGGFAWLAGVVVATFYPLANPEVPFFEKVLRRSSDWVTQVKQLPEVWTQPSASPQSNAAPVAPSPTVEVSPLPSLTPTQQEQVQTEVAQLEASVQTLSDRLTSLETQLGTNWGSEPLENRLAILTQQLAAASGQELPSPAPTTAAAPAIAPVANAINSTGTYPGDRLTVTLPSDLLFRQGQAGLNPQTRNLLDSIVGDLRNYPGASVQVAAHTDNVGEAEVVPDASFQQAQMVQQYLASTLGNDYHWVVVGYGAAYPLAENNSAPNRQRNRRIEIVIDPR